ncbi:MAG: TolC family protein, partial [Armatimonadetes bacterium]|nr:TolC family protein [Armatimonadota bacterium]
MRQREIGRAWATGIGLLLAAQAAGAAEGGLTVAEAVRLGREQSPAVTAARARLAAGKAGVRAAGAPLPLQAELAPGVGFTNGNAFLSRPFDLAGRRTAQRRVAEANRAVLAAEVDRVELVSAADVRLAYAELVRAEAAGRAAGEAVELAREIRDRVARRVELGEAARVQLVRAEIELVRVEQDRVRALGEGVGRRSGLNLLLGRAADAPLTPVDPLVLP